MTSPQNQSVSAPTLAIPPAGPLPTEIVPSEASSVQMEKPCIKEFRTDVIQTSGSPYMVGVVKLGTGEEFYLIGVGEDITSKEINDIQTHYGAQPYTLKQGETFGITGIRIQYVPALFLVSGSYCQ
jgi:hypothetical protein